jgi:hypothetical protein
LCQHLGLGTHEGIDLRPSLSGAQLILPIDRSRLLVECVELPGERVMVIGEGADLLNALCTRRDRSNGVHMIALLSLAVCEGSAMKAVYLGVPARGD